MLTRGFSLSRIALALLLGMLLPVFATASTNDYCVLITVDGLGAFYMSDPRASLPAIRELATNGACAEALLVSNPSTTWPNHTTLITGVSPQKHSVLFNGLLVRGSPGEAVRIEAERNQSDLVAVPTLYERLHKAGYRTAAVNWPCTRGAAALDDNLPDAVDGLRQTTPRLRAELLRAGILANPENPHYAGKTVAAYDQGWTETAVHLLRVRPPNLLLLHLLATDVEQHRNGPQSAAAYDALAAADARVADVIRGLELAGMLERTTIFIASDHGFARPLKLINPNVVLRKAGLLRPGPRRRAQSVSEGGTAFVYLTQPQTMKEDRVKVVELLGHVEGVAAILQPNDYAALHLPDPATNPQMGDLLLVSKQGYTFSDEFFDDDVITPIPIPLGSHGYLASDPRMNGVLIAWGHRIRAGVKLGLVDNRDIAPTIAAVLGEDFPGVEGKVLTEVLATEKH